MARRATRVEMSAEEYRGTAPESAWRATVTQAAEAAGWVVLFELPDKAYAELAKVSKVRGDDGKWRWVNRPGMAHVYAAIRGQPDIILGHPALGVAIAVELKIPGEDAKAHQRERLALYDASGVDAYVWHTGNQEAVDVLMNPFLPYRTFWNGTRADGEGGR